MRFIILVPAMVAMVSAAAINHPESRSLAVRDEETSTALTCEKDRSGDVCASNVNIDECNTAVNDACNTATTIVPGSGTGTLNISNHCSAAFYPGSGGWPVTGQPTDYANCVSKFQAIMSTCIDPAGSGYGKNQMFGTINVKGGGGGSVDETLPNWEIGSKNCVNGGGTIGDIPIAYYGMVYTGE